MSQEIYKQHKHNPPHFFKSNAKYFITGATYQKKHFLITDAIKDKTIDYMFKSFSNFDREIEDWVLLNNHYHIIADAPEDASTLSRVINNFHKFSALWIKKQLDYSPPRIWYNYWDTCITFEDSYYARIHYIWFNAVKHKYVEDAEQWRFGSYLSRIEQKENVERICKNYPCDRINVKDNF